jgi:hypothetical protein
MKSTEKSELILSVLRPQKRKKGLTLSALAAPTDDEKKTIYERTSDSFHELRKDLHFLTGVLTVLPYLQLKRNVQFRDEGYKLLRDAYVFGNTRNASVGSIRKMRVFGEKILKFTEKVEKEAK